MAKRVPGSMRTRKSLSELIEGRLWSADGRGELLKLATRLIMEEALEAESRDALGRDYYEHGAAEGQGWRNGVRSGRLKTAEGMVDYAAPQITGREEPFHSEIRDTLKGRTRALEDLAVELWRGVFRCATSKTPSETRAGGRCCRGPQSRRSASGYGRTTRSSPAATSRSTTSSICSSTA